MPNSRSSRKPQIPNYGREAWATSTVVLSDADPETPERKRDIIYGVRYALIFSALLWAVIIGVGFAIFG